MIRKTVFKSNFSLIHFFFSNLPIQHQRLSLHTLNTLPSCPTNCNKSVLGVRRYCTSSSTSPSKNKGDSSDSSKINVVPEPPYYTVTSGYKLYHHPEVFNLELGGQLPSFQLAYETWGKLTPNKDNVVLIHTGLSASSHAKSHEGNQHLGWWEEFIGPGKPIDTNQFYVICTNLLGGCYGSTGPSSINPKTGKPYATTFPFITVGDMVTAQFKLLTNLGIEKLYASVGSSLGGMQSLMAAALFPNRVQRVISISAAGRSHPMSIAFRYVQRKALMDDPQWHNGRYQEKSVKPLRGMKLAREIGTISYRSGPEWEERFSRLRVTPGGEPTFSPDFQIEGYLDRQGSKLSTEYDPNSLLYISKAMDMFDMSLPPSQEEAHDNEKIALSAQERFEKGLSRVKCPTMILGVQSDVLFPVWQQGEIADILQKYGTSVTYFEIKSKYGHDTFLIDKQTVGSAIKGHLQAFFCYNC